MSSSSSASDDSKGSMNEDSGYGSSKEEDPYKKEEDPYKKEEDPYKKEENPYKKEDPYSKPTYPEEPYKKEEYKEESYSKQEYYPEAYYTTTTPKWYDAKRYDRPSPMQNAEPL